MKRRMLFVLALVSAMAIAATAFAAASSSPPSGWRKVGALPAYGPTSFVGTTGYAAIAGKGVYKTTNGGASWSRVASMPKGVSASDCAFGSKTTGFLSGTFYASDYSTSYPVFYVTKNGGKTWSNKSAGLPPGGYYTIAAIGSKAWLGGDSKTIAYTPDAGATWKIQRRDSSDTGRFEAMYFRDSLHGWASGAQFSPSYKAIVYRTSDGGKTWKAGTISGGSKLNSITFFSSKVGICAGYESERIFRTTDGGVTWKRVSVSGFIGPQGAVSVSSTKGWIAASNGLWQTSNGGKTWSRYLKSASCWGITRGDASHAYVMAGWSKPPVYRWVK